MKVHVGPNYCNWADTELEGNRGSERWLNYNPNSTSTSENFVVKGPISGIFALLTRVSIAANRPIHSLTSHRSLSRAVRWDTTRILIWITPKQTRVPRLSDSASASTGIYTDLKDSRRSTANPPISSVNWFQLSPTGGTTQDSAGRVERKSEKKWPF